MAKPLDPKAKAKKQQKIAIAGAVLFVALLAYQVPKTMKMLNQKPVAAATQPTTTTPTTPTPEPGATATPGATPAASTPSGTATAAGADQFVVNADLSPTPLPGQLAAMTRFSSKDPFQPQDTVAADATTSSGGTSTTSKPPATDSGGGFTTVPGTATPGSTAPAPAPTLGTISINGVQMAVTVKTDFPTDAPLFTLVSLTAKAAKIAIAGGSLATGSKTVTLPLGKSVTLMNTADGTRYELVYVGAGDKTTPVAASSGTGAATPGTTTTTTTTPSTGTSTPASR